MNPPILRTWSTATLTYLALAATVTLGARTVTFEQLWQSDGLHESITDIRFSPDGKTIISGGDGMEDTIHVQDARSGRPLRVMRSPCWKLNYSPDGRILAAGGRGDFCLLDAASGEKIRDLGTMQTGSLRASAWSPDGALIAEGGLDSRVGLHDATTGALVRSVAIEGFCWVLAFSPDGKLLAAGGHRDIALVDVATGGTVRIIKPYPEGSADDGNMDTFAIAFTPDSKHLLTVGTDGVLRVWATATGELARATPAQRCGIMAMDLSPDGTIAAISDCSAINVVDPASGNSLGRVETDIDLSRLLFSPDGGLLAASGGSRLRIYRVVTQP